MNRVSDKTRRARASEGRGAVDAESENRVTESIARGNGLLLLLWAAGFTGFLLCRSLG